MDMQHTPMLWVLSWI
ncbi:hypothetical protein LINGRAHAP2_LOCUS15480 [Linum grandiflorum]